MNRSIFLVIIIFSIAAFISCSGTANVAQKESVSAYPSWYGQQTIVTTDSLIYAYATAIDDDSAAAASKAVDWARAELNSSISYSLENIRNDALEELGDESGLDNPAFIFSLRKVDQAVNDLVSIENTMVKTMEGYKSFRSFAEVKISKEELVQEVGSVLDDNKKAWQTLIESQAFQQF